MNTKDTENKRLEELLKRTHLSEPSPPLKEQITLAAKRTWNQAPPELPWLIPIRRLAASAAAAVVIIWLANYSSDYTLAKWQFCMIPATMAQPTEIETLPEMPYSPFVRRLASLDNRSSVMNASALNSHVETLRHVLDESQQSEFVSPSAPAGGRSGLVPNPPEVNSYS